MSEHHQHQHIVMAVGSGKTFDEAIFNAVAGLTDPQGHHSALTFDGYEVLNSRERSGTSRANMVPRDTSA